MCGGERCFFTGVCVTTAVVVRRWIAEHVQIVGSWGDKPRPGASSSDMLDAAVDFTKIKDKRELLLCYCAVP